MPSSGAVFVIRRPEGPADLLQVKCVMRNSVPHLAHAEAAGLLECAKGYGAHHANHAQDQNQRQTMES